MDIKNNTIRHFTEGQLEQMLAERTARLQDEIDRLRLENQTLQDLNNGLRMEVNDLKKVAEDAEWNRLVYDYLPAA